MMYIPQYITVVMNNIKEYERILKKVFILMENYIRDFHVLLVKLE